MKKKDKNILEQAKSEAEFFDRVYIDMDKNHRLQNYLVPDELIRQFITPPSLPLSDREYAGFLLGNIEGKKLLDYGAGDGWNTICLAKGKAKVWAIDISEKGIELINKKSIANGVSAFVTAEVQNCYKTKYPDSMFDAIYGGGILHHLDIEKAGQELMRILNPSGLAVFREPIRESMIMDVLKAMILFFLRGGKSQLTELEACLTEKRILLLKQYFNVVNLQYFEVLSSASLLIKSKILERFLFWVDYILMKIIPGFKKLGRTVIIELREPRKKY